MSNVFGNSKYTDLGKSGIRNLVCRIISKSISKILMKFLENLCQMFNDMLPHILMVSRFCLKLANLESGMNHLGFFQELL